MSASSKRVALPVLGNPPQAATISAAGLADLPRAEGNGRAIYLETYGCQMNVADSDLLTSILAARGYARVSSPEKADVLLINTCAIREKAEERVYARASELAAIKRRRRDAVLGITGCMAEHLKGSLLARAPEVDIIAGPDSYRRMPEMLAAFTGEADDSGSASGQRPDPIIDVRLDRRETYEGVPVEAADGVSAFVTIQRGCDKFCTFCVVPFTRGRERGVPPREILRQVRAHAEAGAREVVLLGQTVNSYRYEEASFADLLRLVATVDGIERIRFTSPYPVDFSAEVIAAIAEEPKVCKHIHLPVQSGSDAVLSRMKRGYTVDDFRALVARARAAIPGLAITTDILSGFSGETEADHQATLALMREIEFDTAFMFSYSERSLTAAAKKLPDDVPPAEKKRRLAEIITLQEQISAAVNARFVGRTERVLIHARSKRSDDQLVGRTDGFKAVIVPRHFAETVPAKAGSGDENLAPGDFVDVHIERATMATLFGRVARATEG